MSYSVSSQCEVVLNGGEGRLLEVDAGVDGLSGLSVVLTGSMQERRITFPGSMISSYGISVITCIFLHRIVGQVRCFTLR